ncbi:MAG: DUF1080 domain-containing protein [Phycisphaeraceae bacterium]|nr:DUF1080 domain-containing protein [Phycisphaeraceae bacterium]
MNRHSPILLIAAALTAVVSGAEPDEGGFRPLFNGKDLSGWVPVNTAPSTWSVKDGMIHCTGKPIGELRTERMYQNFILEVEWRHLRPQGNAGIFIWADDITARGRHVMTMVVQRLPKEVPFSIEAVDLLGSPAKAQPVGGP